MKEVPGLRADRRPSHDLRLGAELDRRAALKLLASGAALALASCGHPQEQILPYVEIPGRSVPGIPLRFATALPLGGYARGVLVTSVEGRPIKIDGNPRHPASLGATDVFAEASVLSLYDPDRGKAVRKGTGIFAWEAFEAALLTQIAQEKARNGAGLRLVTNRITSPMLIAQIQSLLKTFPEAKWCRYEPVDDDAARAGAAQAFGRPLTAIPRLADARVVFALDADPLGPGPEQIRLGHDFVAARNPRSAAEFLRLYCVEAGWSLTGAKADHRLPLAPQLIRNAAIAIAAELGGNFAAPGLPDPAKRFVAAAASDLKAHRGQALVLVGRIQPGEVHALGHWMNQQLQAPVDLIEPVDPAPLGHAESLHALAEDLAAKRIQTLMILGANPAYDAPGELAIGELIGAVPFSAKLGLHPDETAARATWSLPESHPLESWSDLRAFDGTASLVQPLIRPLYDSRTAHQLLALLSGGTTRSSYELVRTHWQEASRSSDFSGWWRQTLETGIVENSASGHVAPPAVEPPQLAPAEAASGFTVALAPDPSIWDGSFANNAWLQECPKPLTKQVWGNALEISPEDARDLDLVDGSVVHLQIGRAALDVPVLVHAGQAHKVVTATIGYGRSRAGAIGDRVGFDVYRLRPREMPWTINGVALTKTGDREDLLLAQKHFELEGEATDLQPRVSLAELAAGKRLGGRSGEKAPTLYPRRDYDNYAWTMIIDNSACIGCNACVLACQSENNVPVVGPEEMAVGRDMHWLRIDTYLVDERPGFSPIPCMHCEHAPCEPVCPVAASVHDSEGLNAQVYNRCVGTRFCQSNCPYKVRRFNFFGYADGQEYANLGAETIRAVFNPDVTVRQRGVMEKCTYCVQRISRARRTAEKERRSIRDGEVVTACQAACPTRAISFGNRNDLAARVRALETEPRLYELLGHLGTRPRTAYLAEVRNLNPQLEGKQS